MADSTGATVIRKKVVENAYNAFETRTGAVLRAIYQKQIPELSGIQQQFFHVSVRKGKKFGKLVQGKAAASIDAFYARFLEFGTSKMSARPFMRPAFDTEQPATIEAVRAYLAERIPKETEKLGLK